MAGICKLETNPPGEAKKAIPSVVMERNGAVSNCSGQCM